MTDLGAQSWDEVRETVTLPRLRESLRRAAQRSPFWARRFKTLGFDADSADVLEHWQQLPLIDKPELLQDQAVHGIGGTLLAASLEQVRRIHRTSGSTAAPFIVLLTARDTETAQTVGARALRCAGVRSDDLVIHCLNYAMWSGGVTDHMCFETAGAAVIPYGVGNSRYLIETIQRLKPSAISCTPSYLARLRELCRDELGLAPQSLGLRAAFLGGEGGLQEPAYRQQLESEWGMLVVDANYGLSEVLSIFASECEHRQGLHFHGLDALLPELIDPRGRSVPLVAGAVGELVLSTLTREAQPLFRYRTHDQVKIGGMECPCGRRGLLFTVLGRTDDMIIIKGINFFPSALRGVLAEFDAQEVGEYRVERSRSPLDPVHLQVEAAAASGPDAAALTQRITQRVAERLSVSVEVQLKPFGTFPRSDDKTRRVSG